MLSEFLELLRTPSTYGRFRNLVCERCGFRNLRVTTGTWASNGMPCAYALCGHCSDRPGDPIRMCPAGHVRRVTVSQPGITDSDNPGNLDASLEVQACLTDECAHLFREISKRLDLFKYRVLSGDAKAAAEDLKPLARPGQQNQTAIFSIVQFKIYDINVNAERRKREQQDRVAAEALVAAQARPAMSPEQMLASAAQWEAYQAQAKAARRVKDAAAGRDLMACYESLTEGAR